MTTDSRTPEQAPRKPLSARLSDSDPTVGTSGGPKALPSPQAAAQPLDPRDVIRDTIATTLNRAGY